MPPPEQCFLSYAHHDHAAMQRMRTHMRAFSETLGFRLWHDERITAGDYWSHRIEAEIAKSQIFVLLTTPDFFASEYILLHELPAIRSRHRDAGALVIPVIYRRCGWKGFFGDYIQVVPTTQSGQLKPVADWPKPDHGFAQAAESIAHAVEDWFGVQPVSPWAPHP